MFAHFWKVFQRIKGEESTPQKCVQQLALIDPVWCSGLIIKVSETVAIISHRKSAFVLAEKAVDCVKGPRGPPGHSAATHHHQYHPSVSVSNFTKSLKEYSLVFIRRGGWEDQYRRRVGEGNVMQQLVYFMNSWTDSRKDKISFLSTRKLNN